MMVLAEFLQDGALTDVDTERLLQQLRPRLAGLLRRAFPRLGAGRIDDWLQHAATLLMVELEDFDLGCDPLPLLWRMLKNDVIDSLRRREMASLEALATGPAGDSSKSGFQIPDPSGWGPDSIVVEAERLERREKLLSDVLRDYVAECEEREAWTERELMERLLRGQSRQQVAEAIGISLNNLYVTSKKGRDRLRELMEREDVNRSVFVTFFGAPRDRRTLPEDVVPARQADLVALIGWLIEEAGAMCPSDERLAEYTHADPMELAADPKTFRDVRYHVQEAECGLCRAALELEDAATFA